MQSVKERALFSRGAMRSSAGAFWSIYAFATRDWLRSPWVLFNLLALVGVQSLLYMYSPTQSYFFGVQYATTIFLAAVTTGVLFARAARAETYAILARPVPRVVFTGAIMLAAWVISVACHVIATTAVVVRYGPRFYFPPPAWLTLSNIMVGSLAVVVAAAFTVALISLISSFVATPGLRLTVLTIMALLVMSFDSRNFPVEPFRAILGQVPPVLAPLAGALNFATSTPPNSISIVSVVLLTAYAALLIALALWQSSRRELILE